MSAAAIRLCSTFFLDDPNGGHVRTVVSKPHGDPPEVVVVSFTTWKAWKDQSCVVEPGDHPSVPNRSVMSFERAAVVSVAALERQRDRGLLLPRAPLSPELMTRIWDGAGRTNLMPDKARKLLRESGTPI